MKRRLTSVDEFFKDDLETPELKRAYREVLDKELGELLKGLRQNRGLTQKELAQRLGLTRSRVAQIEGAEGLSLALETLARYVNALGYRLEVRFVDVEGDREAARFPLSEAPARRRERVFPPRASQT